MHCWTVNTEEDLDLCRDLGVEAVITDDPGHAVTTCRRAVSLRFARIGYTTQPRARRVLDPQASETPGDEMSRGSTVASSSVRRPITLRLPFARRVRLASPVQQLEDLDARASAADRRGRRGRPVVISELVGNAVRHARRSPTAPCTSPGTTSRRGPRHLPSPTAAARTRPRTRRRGVLRPRRPRLAIVETLRRRWWVESTGSRSTVHALLHLSLTSAAVSLGSPAMGKKSRVKARAASQPTPPRTRARSARASRAPAGPAAATRPATAAPPAPLADVRRPAVRRAAPASATWSRCASSCPPRPRR